MALLAALVLAAVGAWVSGAFAANAPPTPTLTENPSTSPTKSTSETFTFTSSGATGYQCSFNGAAFGSCSSPKTYTSLADGSYSFAVQALKGTTASSSSTYSWRVDTTAPTATVSFPANGSYANAAAWSAGCSPAGLCGTAADASGVNSLQVSIKQNSTGKWWNGSSFSAGLETFVAATLASPNATSTNWRYALVRPSDGGYLVHVQATDALGTAETGSTYAASSSFTIDTVAPSTAGVHITTVTPAGTPTNATSLSWNVTFGEAVQGVSASNFGLVPSGFTGTPTITSVTGSGASWTVTAATTATNTNTASLGLNLSSTAGISDLAGNALTGSVPVVGQAYTAIDRSPPPVSFTNTPPPSGTDATAHFSWITSPMPPDFDHYACSVENGAFSTTIVPPGDGPTQPCASPLTYAVDTSNNGTHQFGVRAYDHLGNYTEIDYSWKVDKGSGQEFAISGNVVGLLYPKPPTATPNPIAISLYNPNSVTIYVTALTVGIDTSTLPAGCMASWFSITQSTVSPTNTVTIPPGATLNLPALTRPTILMTDTGPQDACHGAVFTLTYSGSAHS